jgi:hypothetical protein
MPYDAMLPERFRGRNERIDEPIDATADEPTGTAK